MRRKCGARCCTRARTPPPSCDSGAEQADKHLRRALALDPAHYSAHYLLAVARRNLGDTPGAAANYARFLAAAPRDARKRPNALYGLAGCEAAAAAAGGGGGGGGGLGRLRPMLERAAASERELEPLWGPCEAPEKALLGELLPAPPPADPARRGAAAPRGPRGRGDGRG